LKIGGYPENLWQSEDYAFHIRLALESPSYVVIPEPLVGIRQRENSRSSDKCEVYRDGIKGLKLLELEMPQSHRQMMAEAAISMSRKLYHLGDLRGARAGFAWAAGLGVPTYGQQHWGYRLFARAIGPLYAEWISGGYRQLPSWLRTLLRRS
jgi:hypothetical protein